MLTIVAIVLLALAPRTHTHHVVTQISIYYESVCSDSRAFFLNQLAPTYEKLGRYMDVELVPFGNANVSYPRHDNKPVFHCQHGPNECYGNRAQACVIELTKNTDLAIRFVKCMFEQSDWKDTPATAKRCSESLQLDWNSVKMCADGTEGERLLIANSLKTFNLNPEHSYVPWIVIEKQHTKELQDQAEKGLLKYLCENYYNHEPEIPQCKAEAVQQASQQQPFSGAISLLTSQTMMLIVLAIISFTSY